MVGVLMKTAILGGFRYDGVTDNCERFKWNGALILQFYFVYFQMNKDQKEAREFVLKLTDMMSTYSQIIAWNQDETEIIVKDPTRLTEEVLPKYFRHRKFESFVRQLNMYSFSKVCRQKGNTVSFKNKHFYKANESNFSLIERQKKAGSKTKLSQTLQGNISFIKNHRSIDPNIKTIFEDLINIKNRSTQCNRRFESFANKLLSEMKAPKFKKNENTIEQLKLSAKQLEHMSEEIEDYFKILRGNQVSSNSILAQVLDYFQGNQDMAFVPPNFGLPLLESTGDKRLIYEAIQRNACFGIQSFVSITQFFERSELKIPTLTKLDEDEQSKDSVNCSEDSELSIQANIQAYT